MINDLILQRKRYCGTLQICLDKDKNIAIVAMYLLKFVMAAAKVVCTVHQENIGSIRVAFETLMLSHSCGDAAEQKMPMG